MRSLWIGANIPGREDVVDRILASRLGAVVLLSVPLALHVVDSDHARAIRLASPPELIAYLGSLQRFSFGQAFFGSLEFGILYILAVEALSYLLRRGWRSRGAAA
jgi:hypothetical protein